MVMMLPMGSDFSWEESGIKFRVYHLKDKIKLYAKFENKTVIVHGSNPREAAERAKNRLLNKAPLE